MLTAAILQTLLAGLSRTIGRNASDRESAAALLESFHPETPMQAMLAAQAIALHHAAMDCFGRAMETAADDGATVTRLQRNAASLTRAFTATLRTLQRCQAEAAKEAEATRQDPMRRTVPEPRTSAEPAAAPPRPEPPPSAPAPSSAWQDTPPGQDPMQRERRWEELSEAEQFAILYPDRVAAGARGHEDADLWLPRITTQPDSVRARR